MSLAQTGPLVSPWLVIPLCGIVVAILTAYMSMIRSAEMPASRRRIRIANTWVMLLTTPVLAYAFGIVTAAERRPFVLAWATAVGLLGIIIMLALLDILNNHRLARRDQAELRRQLRELRASVGARPDPSQGNNHADDAAR